MGRFRYGIGQLCKILLIGILAFSLSIPAMADSEEGLYVWDDFSAGLNTEMSPFTLPANQGDIAENTRFYTELQALTKRNAIMSYGTADATEPILGMHRQYVSDGTKVLLVNHGDEIETGNDNTGVFTNILTVGTGSRRWQRYARQS